MVNTQAFYDREFGEETPDEGCMWEEADCPLSLNYKNDMYDIGSVANKAGEIKVPWLLVHGDEDDVVPSILGNFAFVLNQKNSRNPERTMFFLVKENHL